MSDSESLQRETESRDGIRTVRWRGRLTTDAALVEKAALIDGLDAGERLFVFDLTGVSRMSSFVIGVLVASLKRVRARHGVLHLVLTPAQVRMFEVLRLDVVFPIYLREEDAYADLAPPGRSRP